MWPILEIQTKIENENGVDDISNEIKQNSSDFNCLNNCTASNQGMCNTTIGKCSCINEYSGDHCTGKIDYMIDIYYLL